jgi:hypothetical protein
MAGQVKRSGRRGFVRKLLSVTALAGITGLLVGQAPKTEVPTVQAVSGSALIINAANDGEQGTTTLTANTSGSSSATFEADNDSTYDGSAAIKANSTALSGATYGVYGYAGSINGRGVHGFAGNESGATAGVEGYTNSIVGTGVYGFAANFSGSTFGVWGQSNSNKGIGVYGVGWNSSGDTVGVYGEATNSNTGTGVVGWARGTGVRGDSPGGFGVLGNAYVSSSGNYAQGVVGLTEDLPNPGPAPIGVLGAASMGVGVQGTSVSGIGVLGLAWFAPACKPIVARGSLFQTANLQEWQSVFGNTFDAIDALGRLGIGTGSPSYAVDLRTPGSSSSQMHITPVSGDSGGYLTSANPGNLFMAGGAAWNGSAWVAKSSTAYQYGGGPAGVRFFFDTGLTIGSAYTPTTRMFIGPTGHVGIGMSTQPAHLLQLGLDDAAKPSTNTWTIASDGRLKDPESIEPFTEGSELIRRLPQPVWFRYRKDSGLPSDRRVAGWVAQEVAPVAPFMVRKTRQKLRENDAEETETLSLNTNELPYALVNSVKDLISEIGELHEGMNEITKLKYEVSRLQMRIELLEQSHIFEE